jgi:hypothetical protein
LVRSFFLFVCLFVLGRESCRGRYRPRKKAPKKCPVVGQEPKIAGGARKTLYSPFIVDQKNPKYFLSKSAIQRYNTDSKID